MNPDKRTTQNSVPVAVHEEPDAVTVVLDTADSDATGSLTLGEDTVETAPPGEVERQVDSLLGVALEAVGTGPEATVRVPRTLLATLADETNRAAGDVDDDERLRAIERAYDLLGYQGEVD